MGGWSRYGPLRVGSGGSGRAPRLPPNGSNAGIHRGPQGPTCASPTMWELPGKRPLTGFDTATVPRRGNDACSGGLNGRDGRLGSLTERAHAEGRTIMAASVKQMMEAANCSEPQSSAARILDRRAVRAAPGDTTVGSRPNC